MHKVPQLRFQCAPLPTREYDALKRLKWDVLGGIVYRDVLAILTRTAVSLLKEEGGYERLLAVKQSYLTEAPSETEELLPAELVARFVGQKAEALP